MPSAAVCCGAWRSFSSRSIWQQEQGYTGKAMSSTSKHPAHERSILPFLGLACGVGVSTIYYSQPLLLEIGRAFHATAAQAGMVAVAIQVGYALGLLLLVPLGDLRERRGLMMRLYGAVSIALLLVAFAPTLPLLIAASALAGALASVTHIALPIAPDLAPKGKGGHAVGVVMSGLLLGVLLARTFAGWINDAALHIMGWLGHPHAFAGWRAVFVLAAFMNAAFVPALPRFMPPLPAKQHLPYRSAMWSLWTVFREEPLLRESCTLGALLFAAFSCLWNTLAFLLGRHGLGAGVAGTFGLVGAAGVAVAGIAGRQSDKRGPRWVLSIGLVLLALPYAALWLSESIRMPLWGHIAALTIGIVVLDMGQQMSQIANQTRIFALRPQARSRINTVYMVTYFAGAAIGSALSTFAWAHWQWNGVCALALLLIGLAALRHATGIKKPFRPSMPSDHTRDFVLEG